MIARAKILWRHRVVMRYSAVNSVKMTKRRQCMSEKVARWANDWIIESAPVDLQIFSDGFIAAEVERFVADAGAEAITPTSDSALEIGCVCTTTLMAHTTAINAKMRKSMTSIYFVVQATRKLVTSKLSMATGKRNFHVKPISWS